MPQSKVKITQNLTFEAKTVGFTAEPVKDLSANAKFLFRSVSISTCCQLLKANYYFDTSSTQSDRSGLKLHSKLKYSNCSTISHKQFPRSKKYDIRDIKTIKGSLPVFPRLPSHR